MATKPPDEHEIVGILEDLRTNVYKGQDAQIDSTRETREQRKTVKLPNAWVDIQIPDTTVADEIARVADTLNVNPPKWHIEIPPDAPDNVQANATLRQKVAAAVFDVCGQGDDNQTTIERMIDSCVGDGGAWGKFLFSKDLWEERYALKRGVDEAAQSYVSRTDEAAKRAGPPFYFGYSDPRNVYPAFSGRHLGVVVEVSQRPLYSTLRKYKAKLDGNNIVPGDIGSPAESGQKLPQSVEFIEYWDDEWCCYVIKGQGDPFAVKPYRHRYGRVPYFPAYGFMMGHWANRKVGYGVAETKRWLCDYMAYLLVTHANVAARDALTPVLEYLGENARPQGAVGEKQAPRRIPIGEIIQVPFGNKYEGFPITDTAPALREQIKMIGDKIEAMLTPRVTSQIGGGLEGAGFAINQVLAESKIHHHPFVSHLERCFEQMTYFMEDLIRSKVREKVWVFVAGNKNYLGEAPSDLDQAVKYSVELDPERPAAKLIESRYHIEQVEKRMESLDQSIEAQGRNPDEVRQGIDAQEIRDSDEVRAWRKQVILQKMGYGHLMLLTQQAQQVAQTGQFPNGQPVKAMGTPEVPDMGNLAAKPNQAAPDTGGPAPTNGNMGTPEGAVQPMAREAQAA